MSENIPSGAGLFVYQGPATIGGVDFPEVSLHEERQPFDGFGYQRSWEGMALVLPANPPPLFGMPNTPTLDVVLPDGREGRVCASAEFRDGRWLLEITGVGPAPRCAE